MFFACASCASLRRSNTQDLLPPDVLLSTEPTLDELIQITNQNSARIQQLQASNARIRLLNEDTIDYPLSASYAFDRPRRFRLRAGTSFTGDELDLGSNDDTYWIWVKRDDRKKIYFGRHSEYYQSAARQVLPVPPDWLAEALGVVQFDANHYHTGPSRNRPGQLEVQSRIQTPGGELLKITVFDERYAWVLEQHVYDASNQLLASALASDFYYDPAQQVSLPRNVEINLPTANIHFTMNTPQHQINQLSADPAQLWSMPQPSGYDPYDLGGNVASARSSLPNQRVAMQPNRPSWVDLRYQPGNNRSMVANGPNSGVRYQPTQDRRELAPGTRVFTSEDVRMSSLRRLPSPF